MRHRGAEGRAEVLLERGLQIAVVVALVIVGIAIGSEAHAETGENVLNLYSARHYETDEALYGNFTRQAGIRINRIELGHEPLLRRLRSEGANSPADVVLLVDAARPALESLGAFKADRLPVAVIGKSIVPAQQSLDRVGYP